MARSELPSSAAPTPTPSAAVEHPDRQNNGFMQRPFVQNVLPFITSLSVHAGILIFGLLVFGAVKLVQMPALQEEVIIPESLMVDHGPPGGIPNVGPNNDPMRDVTQDKELKTDTKGLFDKKSDRIDLADAGAPGENASMIGPGSLSSFGGGKSNGPGGNSGSGPLAMFGPGGGGAYGPKGAVFVPGRGGNARLIVFLCDATGSMINKMATLKDELNKTVVGLRPIQSFDIVFYQGVRVEPMAPGLIAATPENKRKAGTYLEGVTATDTTDPIPSLIFALKLKPQLMYFLTDAADFPDPQALLEAIKKYNPQNATKINTILFVENKAERDRNADSEGLMKKIASESGGTFRWVEMDQIP